MRPDAIATRRLQLVAMAPDFLRASLSGDTPRAEALLGACLPAEWRELAPILELRLRQLEAAPDLAPWLTRAVVLAAERRVVGVSGFHGPPGGDWLRDFAPGGVEFGYTIFLGDRARGFATEAGDALVRWASETHGVRRYLLSIGPANAASAAVAAKLGFRRVGEWVHDTRGLEHVWVRVTDS